ncbi:hypothetical protein A4H02_05465 [Fervidobacterium thailandense]|uniref:Mpv17/PMP22 family protein n=1 Tax=Fervidobacterium thailandense TaxID=1008305 RepID=A0A1E3G2K5_9BACT|nr:hypothetical protein A4H02_05465 [Fervidobacterium thailandense]
MVTFFILLLVLLTTPTTRAVYIQLNSSHPYLLGFLKVGILATLGEIISKRIASGKYEKLVGLPYRFLIWGLLGIIFVPIFELYFSGVRALLNKKLLPCVSSMFIFFQAFYTSLIMNLTFAPVFMAFHRITDAYIDLGGGKISSILKLKFKDVLKSVNWNHFTTFVLFKTIPFFWIPAHTITFLLPSNFRILTAALLSVALGILLSIRSSKPK